MATDNKRKWRWSSKGFFGHKASNKRINQDMSSDNDTVEAVSPLAVVDVALDSSKLPFKTHCRDLSTAGVQANGGTCTTDKSLSHTSERGMALAIARDAAKAPSLVPSCIDPYSGLGHPFMRHNVPGACQRTADQQQPLSIITEEDARRNAVHHQLESVTINVKARDRKGRRQSILTPNLAHQMSHKLSQTFGNPTIVHRPNLRPKPGLVSVHGTTVLEPDLQRYSQVSPQDSTSPSSFNYSGSVSATNPSTGKTSLESGPSTPCSVNIYDGRDVPTDTRKAEYSDLGFRETTLTPIREVQNPVTPTFVTVETTANAKIFFETHFNSLLARHASPRSLRRRDLELYLEARSLPEEQRQIERWAWANHESDHLRQSRVLKSRFNEPARASGVAIAGYEIVRILGKGSFGVVRLVREKESAANGPFLGSQTDQLAQGLKQHDARGDNASLKMTTIDTLDSMIEEQKATQSKNPIKARRDVYAMKVIRKSDMLRNCQEGHLRAERDFLVASEKSRWVVPLIASFQDNRNLYLVMEYMVGGDFLGLLFRKDKLKEKQARWYIAEMILCVEETHRSRWIHRDIKPDNFLISSSGHLKVSDFGLAFDGHWAHDQKYFKNTRASLMEKLGIKVKGDSEDQEEDEKKKPRSSIANILTGRIGDSPPKTVQFDGPNERESVLQWKNRTGKRRMAASVVGTSQYMAPEVIRGDLYDGRCDWWSIGIILYECLYGFTPFVCENREDTKAKILNNAHSLIFPDERDVERSEKVSFEAMELINSLLQEKEHRLSSNKYKVNDWQHTRHRSGQSVGKRADPSAHDYAGNFVYPDDASDIKGHPFFSRIIWERLHLTRPPWVPLVSGMDDTKWFDDEEGAPISEVDDATSKIGDDDEASDQVNLNGHGAGHVTQVDGANAQQDQQPTHSVLSAMEEDEAARHKATKAKAKKRPRDRVLRDKEVGRKALELRKKGAFLGYTYRRPKLLSFDDERERQRMARRSLIPNFE